MSDETRAAALRLAAALHLRRRQLEPSRPKPTKTSAEIEAEVRRFIDLLRDGVDSHEAAGIIGISFPTMLQRLYDRGFKLRDFQ